MRIRSGHLYEQVWADNLDEELDALRLAVEKYPVVSMVSHFDPSFPSREVMAQLARSSCFALQDTEFPGIVARPIGTFRTGSDYHFQTMRCNVDLLKIIQLGLTLADEEGNMPEVCCWQFNFRFSLR